MSHLLQPIRCAVGKHDLEIKYIFFKGTVQECECKCCHREFVLNHNLKAIFPLDRELKFLNRLLSGGHF